MQPKHILSILILALALFTQSLWADGFRINTAEAEFDESSLSVDAKFDLQMSNAVAEALHNGVSVELTTTLDLHKNRRYIWDDRIARWVFRHRINFHPLTNRYVLHHSQDSEQQSYSSLDTLLKQIESFEFESEISGNTLPQSKHGYKLRLRIALNRNALPAPLRVMAHVLPAWWLKSETYEWVVKG